VCVALSLENFTPTKYFAIRKTRAIKKMKEGEKAGGNPEVRRTGDIVISCTCFL